ncbi:MAG: aldehyde dehydrogenase (NADP(+)) [Chthonomonas sp.]|nr:aldehyde dehydrogenase (NADP(+)) [Chthonomonas sp.]
MSTLHATNPATNDPLPGEFPLASRAQMDVAVRGGHALLATDWIRNDALRAGLLEQIAVNMEAARATIVERANLETALPLPRLNGELDRTCMQIRLFARLIGQTGWRGDVHVPGNPNRAPLPRPDMRQTSLPIGPIAVFGASNFPLAYSVMGGDSASALAAGCSIVVKAHSAHPGTSELVAGCVRSAIREVGAPGSVFECLFLSNDDAGALVQHESLAGVGFTGSLGVGRHLMDLAAARPRPIPVFAEMGSMNPQFVFPGRLAEGAAQFAEAFFGSLTLGVGQFCTNPGIVVAVRGPALDAFRNRLVKLVNGSTGATMLTAGIAENYRRGCDRFRGGSALLGHGEDSGANTGSAAIFEVEASAFLANPDLRHEVFGPAALLVVCDSVADFAGIAEALTGQLAASLHMAAADAPAARDLLRTLPHVAGRIIANGFPTGLEVGAATVHGGPYPAASDSRFTAVGDAAIRRWLRPVCYQDFPSELLG